jgi:hypothetical protein
MMSRLESKSRVLLRRARSQDEERHEDLEKGTVYNNNNNNNNSNNSGPPVPRALARVKSIEQTDGAAVAAAAAVVTTTPTTTTTTMTTTMTSMASTASMSTATSSSSLQGSGGGGVKPSDAAVRLSVRRMLIRTQRVADDIALVTHRARVLCATFLVDNAENMVNIVHSVRRAACDTVVLAASSTDGGQRLRLLSRCFDTAQKEVFDLLNANVFHAFLRSSQFATFLNRRNELLMRLSATKSQPSNTHDIVGSASPHAERASNYTRTTLAQPSMRKRPTGVPVGK